MTPREVKKTLALPLNFLRDGKPISFDIYVWAGGKPVLYCRSDDVRINERVERLKNKKGLQYFLVLKQDYSSFIEYLGGELETVFSNSNRTLKEQVTDIYFQQRGLLIVLSADPTSKEYYSILRSTCSSYFNFFCQNPEALKYLYECSFESKDSDLWLDHSIRVTALASRLISESKVDEPGKPIYEIIMGSFVHDFGYLVKEWPITNYMDLKNLNYKTHPENALELFNLEHVNPWVKSVIHKHEEHIDGSGFPTGAREDEIDPTIQCVAVANAFDRLRTLQKLSADDALKRLLIEKMGAYPLPLLQCVQNIIKEIS